VRQAQDAAAVVARRNAAVAAAAWDATRVVEMEQAHPTGLVQREALCRTSRKILRRDD